MKVPGSYKRSLLAAGVFSDSLCAFRDCVFGQFSGQKETNSGLYLTAGDGGALIVVGETAGFSGDSLKQIVDKTVHDRHGFAGNTSVRVNLFHDFVDVDRIAFLPLPFRLLAIGTAGLGLTGLLSAFRAYFWSH